MLPYRGIRLSRPRHVRRAGVKTEGPATVELAAVAAALA